MTRVIRATAAIAVCAGTGLRRRARFRVAVARLATTAGDARKPVVAAMVRVRLLAHPVGVATARTIRGVTVALGPTPTQLTRLGGHYLTIHARPRDKTHSASNVVSVSNDLSRLLPLAFRLYFAGSEIGEGGRT